MGIGIHLPIKRYYVNHNNVEGKVIQGMSHQRRQHHQDNNDDLVCPHLF